MVFSGECLALTKSQQTILLKKGGEPMGPNEQRALQRRVDEQERRINEQEKRLDVVEKALETFLKRERAKVRKDKS